MGQSLSAPERAAPDPQTLPTFPLPILRSPYDDIPLILRYLCCGSPAQVKQAVYQIFHPASDVGSPLFRAEISILPWSWNLFFKDLQADSRDLVYLYWRLGRWLSNEDFQIEILDRRFQFQGDRGILKLRLRHTFALRLIPRLLYHPVVYYDSVFLLRRRGDDQVDIRGGLIPMTHEQLTETRPTKPTKMDPPPHGILKYASEPRNPATWPRGWNDCEHSHNKVVHFADSANSDVDKPQAPASPEPVTPGTSQDLQRRIDHSREARDIGEYLYMLVVDQQQAMSTTVASWTENLMDIMGFLANDSEICCMIRFLSAFYQQPRYEALQQALAHGTASCQLRYGCASNDNATIKQIIPRHLRNSDLKKKLCYISSWCAEQLNDMEPPRKRRLVRTSDGSSCSTAISSVDDNDDRGTYFDWRFIDPIDARADDRPRTISNKNVKDYIIKAPTSREIVGRPGRIQLLHVVCHSSHENDLKKMYAIKRRLSSGVADLLDLETEMDRMAQETGIEHTPLRHGTREDLHSHRPLELLEEDIDGVAVEANMPVPPTIDATSPYTAGSGIIENERSQMMDGGHWVIVGWHDYYTAETLINIFTPTPLAWIAVLIYRCLCVVWVEFQKAFTF